MSGSLSNGRFMIQRRIGAGGMGVVYEAFDRDRGQSVALKKLLGTDATAIGRLKHEFRALADVVHPNLVRLYELIGEEEEWFFTMELVEGVDFLEFLRGRREVCLDDDTTDRSTSAESPTLIGHKSDRRFENEPAPAEPRPLKPSVTVIDYDVLRRTLRQLGEGVSALHDSGKLHRDLKPSNVLVTADERVVVLDFGLATDVTAFQKRTTFGGTPAYMAPEQIAEMPSTTSSDCYAIGVMAYEALTGALPFSGNFYSMLMQKKTTDPLAPIELDRRIPEDLSRTCIELMRRDPETRLSARALAERMVSRHDRIVARAVTLMKPRETPFIGRIEQIEQLESAFKASSAATPVTVMLRGSSGMGKTALVRHFLHEVQRRDPSVVVFTGRCYEQESVPYKAVDSLIDDLARYLKQLSALEARALMPTDVAALARLFPVLQELDSVSKTRRKVDVLDSQELRRRAFAALRELMARMVDEHRVILHLDDVQWGDRDSAALLAELLRPPDSPPLLVIAAYRSEEADTSPLLTELRRIRETDENALGEVREVQLGELAGNEAHDLARALHLDTTGSSGRVDAIAREAGGSPFFIIELSRFSESSGLSELDSGEMALDHVIRSRIAQLPAGGRDLLEIVAVAGRPIMAKAANAAASLRPEDEAMLARLRADHLLRTRRRAGRDEVDTYHDRIREAILSAIEPDRRRAHHLTIARALEALGARDPEVLAVHYRAGGDDSRAASYAVEAGDRAAAALAFENAAELFAMALEVSPDAPAPLLVKFADALANAGRGADAATQYLRAAGLLESSQALELRRRALECLLRTGHIDEGLNLIRDVLDSVGFHFPETPRKAVLGVLWNRLRLLLRGLETRPRSAQDVAPLLLTQVDVCWGLVTGLGRIDNIRAAYFQQIHVRLALDSGEPHRVARALASEACFQSTKAAKGLRRTDRLISLADRHASARHDPHIAGMCMLARSMSSYYLGHFRDAAQKAGEAEAIFRERCTNAAWEISTTINYTLTALYYLGEITELAQRVPQRLREAEEHGDLYAALDPSSRAGIIWLAADDPDTARRAIRQVMDRWSLRGFHLQHYLEWFTENQIDLYTGHAAAAWRRCEERWPLMKKSLLLRVPFLQFEALHLLGRSALAAANAGGDRKLLDRVLRKAQAIEKMDGDWMLPFALALRGGVTAAHGSTADAIALFDRAAKGFEEHGVALYAKAATWRRGMLLGDRTLSASAEAWMTAQGVRNVQGIVNVLVP